MGSGHPRSKQATRLGSRIDGIRTVLRGIRGRAGFPALARKDHFGKPTTPWFSLLTMNQHPVHIDAHYAAGTQHGQRLVVGPLVFSIVVGMSVADISGRAIANLDYSEVKHVGPGSTAADTIYAESSIADLRESRSKRIAG